MTMLTDAFRDSSGFSTWPAVSLTIDAEIACSVIVARLEGEKDVLNNA